MYSVRIESKLLFYDWQLLERSPYFLLSVSIY